MRIHSVVRTATVAAVLAITLGPERAAAQLSHASATTLGLAGNVTASARGVGAIAANPAGLAMPGSGFTLALLPAQVRPGLGPITLADVSEWGGETVPAATRQSWLDKVHDQGAQAGSAAVEVSAFALSAGHFGVQVSSVAATNMSLAPDVTELILFGNAGRTNAPVTVSLGGSTLEAFAITTLGGSFALPLPSAGGAMAVGATVKYSIGHGVASGQVVSGTFASDPLAVDLEFPLVTNQNLEFPFFGDPGEDSDEGGRSNVGTGVGLDLGFQMERGPLGLGVALINAVSTFKWDEEGLVYRPGTASWDANGSEDDFEEQPLGRAPASARSLVEDLTFDPLLAVGASYDLSEAFTVTADLHNRFGDGIELGPKFHLGAGAEYRGLRVLHLRGGAAAVTGGAELAAGASLVLGPVNLSAAGGMRSGDAEDTQMFQLTLSFGGR